MGLSTTAIHGGETRPTPGMGVTAPLVQSVNYVQDSGTSEGLLYTRYGNTPNAERVQKRLALLAQLHELEGREAVMIFVVHDLNPRAMSPKVHGFVQAQSWFQDLTRVSVMP